MHEQRPRVLISILNWNNFSATASCIQSVLAQKYLNFSILVVDNASKDDSIKLIKDSFPFIEIVELKENKGYAAAHEVSANMAIEQKFDLFWILNNDLEVIADTLENLVLAFSRNGLAIYGSLSLEIDGKDTINFAGGWELSKRGGLDYATPYNQFMDRPLSECKHKITERKVSDVNGCSMLIPMEIIKKHGFMDGSFFLYKEETDYCFTLMEKGIPSIIVPNSIVYHKSGGSFFNQKLKFFKTYYSERNMVLFMNNHPKFFIPSRNPIKKYRAAFNGFIEICKLMFTRDTENESFYKNLGIIHGTIGIRGKYFKPENYL